MESVVQPLKNIQGEVLQKAKGWGCRWGNLPVLARYRIGTFAPCANPVAGKAQVKSVIKVVLGSSRQWRTTILQVVLAVM
ncbi:hypothetical protein LLW87_002926 [Salmonella enterica]|nr:hypothetical protein [Salmonella enterica]EJY2799202.1 hypothetical protein [Salmonella enterica]